MESARLQLLGTVGITTADGLVRGLSSPQARVAAARLVLERRRAGTSRRELAETIWPGELPDTWASALRSVVTRVRRLVEELGSDVTLHSVGGRYMLQMPADVVIDLEYAVASLARAAEALAGERPAEARLLAASAASMLERGFLLDHESEWADSVRAQLDEARIDAYDLVARAALAASDADDAANAARTVIDRAPLRESGYRVLMQAQFDSGNRGEGLATYARLRQMLSDELGIDPSPETENLYFRLLSVGDEEQDDATSARIDDDERESKPRVAEPSGRAFVGRADALQQLREVWAQAAPNRPTMAIVTGELGLGKSSLVTEFAKQIAPDGAVFLMCVGRGGDRRRPAIVQALVNELPRLHRDLRRVIEPLVADAEIPSLVRALSELAAGRRLLLVVDDIDEADEKTVDVVQAILASRGAIAAPDLDAAPSQTPAICILATAEPSRGHPSTLRLMHEMEKHGSVWRVRLPRFSVVDAHDFVSTLPAVTQENASQLGRLLTASGGNPYLFARLVETDPSRPDLASTLLGGLRDYTRIRTTGLGRIAARLIRAAAVAGPVFDVEVVGRAADLGEEEVSEALEELVRFELVSPDDTTATTAEPLGTEEYRFVHGALCDAVYADLAKTERARLHRRITEELAECEALQLPGQRTELGLRTTSAAAMPLTSDGGIALRWRAAEQAGEQGDVEEAVRLRRDVLDMIPPGDDGLRARALTALGVDELRIAHPRARAHLLEATLLGLDGAAVGVALSAATSLVDDLASDPDGREDARATCEQVLDLLRRRGAMIAGDPEVDQPLGRFLARHLGYGASASSPDLLRRGAAGLTSLVQGLGHPLEAESRADVARELAVIARSGGDADALVLAAHHGASAAAVRQCPAERAEFGEMWREAMEGHPEPRAFSHLRRERDLVELTNGNTVTWSEATCYSPDALSGEVSDAVGGDLTGRQRLVARWLGFRNPSAWSSAGSSTTSDAHSLSLVDTAFADVVAGRIAAARSRLRLLLTADRPFADDDPSLHDGAVMAIVAAASRDAELIGTVRERLQPFAMVGAGHGYRTGLGPVAFHLARLAAAVGDLDDAERLLLSGLTSVAHSRARVWVAAHQLGMASVLERRRTTGDLVASQVFRREARRIVDPADVRLSIFDAP